MCSLRCLSGLLNSLVTGCLCLVLVSEPSVAQEGPLAARTAGAAERRAAMAEAEADEEDGPLVADSTVGYIDNPIVGNQFRFRYDSNYNARQPARAEYLWPVGGKRGPGPGPDTSVDYQDLAAYTELEVADGWSLFGEVPVRFANPEIQDNTAGLGDSNFGFRHAFGVTADSVQTFQFRVYVPTGDGDRGLGTDHVSLEPGLLWYEQLAPRLTGFAELKDWIAIDGSEGFAGNVLRYGVGASYVLLEECRHRNVSAVTEFVGWTVLDGGSAITTPGPVTRFVDAAGDTIVNAKVGLRWRISVDTDVYGGYGRGLTGDTHYSDMLRLELRRSW